MPIKKTVIKDLIKRTPYKTQENFNKRIKEWQAKKGYLILDYLKYRVLAKKATNRLRHGILRAKQLEELKLKEQITIFIRFKERYTKGCNKAAIR